jgi:hypothetical protein
MKRIIYVILFAAFSSLTITACTEDEVVPTQNTDNGGGNGSADPLKP